MNNISINFNNINSADLDLLLTKKPTIPFSNFEYEQIDIDGRDGSYYVDKGLQDVVISIEFNFSDDHEEIRYKIRQIRKWITDINDYKLSFSYDQEVYYKVKSVNLNECTFDNIYEIQTFSIDFTVSPFQYQVEGIHEVILNNTLYNFWDDSAPVYKIRGNGTCVLNINGTVINCSIENELMIDTEHDKIISNGILAVGKTNIKDMKKLFVLAGENKITWTNGFTIYITPNYRTVL